MLGFEGVWSKHLNPTRPRSDRNLFPPTAAGSGLAANVCKPRGRGRNDTFPVDRETRSRLTARLLGFARGTGPAPAVTRA